MKHLRGLLGCTVAAAFALVVGCSRNPVPQQGGNADAGGGR
jgi:hypothetical protein